VARTAPTVKTLSPHEFYARLVRDARTLPELYAAMEGWAELVVGENPILECQQGCARCCHHQVLVGEREWAMIHTWLRDHLTVAHRAVIAGRVKGQMAERGNPLARWLGMRNKLPRAFVRAVGQGFRTEATRCAMLGDDNRCEIYPARPFVCRAYGRAMLSNGTPMFCEIFNGRLRQRPQDREGMTLEQMEMMSPKYFELNDADDGVAGRFTIMSAHVLRQIAEDGSMPERPVPLAEETRFPVVGKDDFPTSK